MVHDLYKMTKCHLCQTTSPICGLDVLWCSGLVENNNSENLVSPHMSDPPTLSHSALPWTLVHLDNLVINYNVNSRFWLFIFGVIKKRFFSRESDSTFTNVRPLVS